MQVVLDDSDFVTLRHNVICRRQMLTVRFGLPLTGVQETL